MQIRWEITASRPRRRAPAVCRWLKLAHPAAHGRGLEETAPTWYPKTLMSGVSVDRREPVSELPPRLKRTLELVYAVPGVVAAQVWQCPGQIAVGVRGGVGTAPAALLDVVQSAVAGLKEPGETWEFGILEDVVSSADAQARR